jgi:DNA uptake protein ComE-like DNA-binding protein
MKQTLWKEYFNFSKQERIGITVLLVLISICISAPAAWEYYHPPVTEGGLLWKTIPHISTSGKGWVKLGESPHKQPKDWKKKDQQRIYGPAVRKRDTTYTRKRLIIDVNSADSITWTSLPGIGPVLASRIIRFRNKLGGFYAISQVRETYGLADTTFVKIQPYLQLNTVSLKNLDINQLDEKSLAQHPYIRYKMARLIVLYRNNNGPFRHAEELLDIPLVDDSIYRKLEPYIKTIK